MLEKLYILLSEASSKKFNSIRYGIKCCSATEDYEYIQDIIAMYNHYTELQNYYIEIGDDTEICELKLIEEIINTL